MSTACFEFVSNGPWPLAVFPQLSGLQAVAHGVTDRRGPAFGTDAESDDTARAAALAAAAVGLEEVAWIKQVHGGRVLAVRGGGLAGQADGLVSDTPGLGLLGRSADCPLVLAAGQRDDGSWAVGFAHASWRATIARITATMLRELVHSLDVRPASVHAAIAPSAGPCCYEVGDEVVVAAAAALGPRSAVFFGRPDGAGDRVHFDLWAANRAQLLESGVPAAQISMSDVCTICRGERFWSWRREGESAGRFAAVIGVRL